MTNFNIIFLEAFLEAHNIKCEFYRNVSLFPPSENSYGELVVDKFIHLPIDKAFIHAFIWSETAEGGAYWDKLHIEWLNTLDAESILEGV